MEYKVQEHLHYAGIASWNHCEVTQNVEGADIVVVGVPFDNAVTFRPGIVAQLSRQKSKIFIMNGYGG